MGVTRFDVIQANAALGFGQGIPATTGNTFFVSSVNGSNGNDGKSPLSPVATLVQAVTNATASNGDVIVLMPGHAETITGAAGSGVTKAGLQVIGLGVGANRPTFTFTTAVGASFDITAANTTINNCRFVCGIDNQTAMMNISAADVSIFNSEFTTNTATVGAAIGILTAATATRFWVEGCVFYGPAINAGTTTTAQIDHEVGVDYIIRNNWFTGKCTQNITNGATILRGLIDNNRFVTYTGTKAINMAAASTPFITNNRINVPSGTAPIVAAAGFVAGNVYSAAAGVTAGTASTF